jgi:VWFA-related protein
MIEWSIFPMNWFVRSIPVVLAAALTYAQEKPPAETKPAAEQNASEMVQHDETATFRTRVNLVMVPVVVHNRKGDAIGNLEKADFTLFDKGKPQEITRFSVEKTGPGEIKESDKTLATPDGQAAPADLPDRFLAYVFDEIHVNFGDLVRAREAAWHNMLKLEKSDRAAIFTTSGQVELEFTDNRDKLRESLMRLQPRPIARSNVQECPDISYYMADLIFNKHDPTATDAAVAETMICAHMPPDAIQQARQMVDAASSRMMSVGRQESRVALMVLKDIVRRMSGTPGQRIIILASPGFITPELQQDKNDILDRAVRAKVVINTLDARGLWTDPSLDASRQVFSTDSLRVKSMIDRQAATEQADVLAELASGSGGSFFHNNNDLDEGYMRLGTAPEFVYLLGFSPQNLKHDGTFHSLKVTLKNSGPLSIDARKGYYAPRQADDQAATAKREIEEALFSREEMRELPVDLKTQFFKSNEETAKVAVLAHVDMKKIKFRKDEGRNKNTLTMVAGLFDRNGNFVEGITKTIEFKLKDDTLENRLGQGITVRTSFDVKPGTYLVRLVVRDAEGQMMSASNGAVEIP